MEWVEKKSSELYVSSSGLSKSSDQFGYGYPFLSYKDVFNNYYAPDKLSTLVNSTEKDRMKCSVKQGDVFLTRTSETTDELGMSCVALHDYVNATFNGFTKRLRPLTDEIEPKYAAYYFRSPYFRSQCISLASLITRASLNDGMIRRLKIRYPLNRKVQEKIGEILYTYDTLIENNTKRIRLLEKMAENLYKEWFVRFRFPGHENVEMENGLPKGWKYVNFSNLSPILTGKKDANYASQNGKYKFFTCSKNDLVADNYSFDCFAIILAGNGDLNVKLYDGQFEAYQRTYVLSPYDVEHIYVSYYTIQSELDRLLVGAAGGVIKFLTKGMIEKIKVLLPTNDVLVRFNSIQEHNYRLRQNLKRQISLLARQRDLLLPRLMSGKLEVKEELLE